MTIVDLADLDTFIRDSLFEVRRGIANSRNATQSNPMLGVMVDLPEKVDFEIMVTTSHQSLTRNVISSETDNSLESTSESQSSVGGTESSTSTKRSSYELELSVGSQHESSDENGLDIQASDSHEGRTSISDSVESSSESDKRTQGNSQAQSDVRISASRQNERHLEANDRASKTFDEEEGSWGGQGQISTPTFVGGAPCTCS